MCADTGSGNPNLQVSAPWYAVYTQPYREGVAEAHLRRFCEDVFCPRYRRRLIRRGYRHDAVRPLFPNYVFAAFDHQRRFRAVHYARGVRRVVTFGGEPAVVPAELLAGIAARMEDGVVVLPPPRWTSGERVEIVAGPLQGWCGIFERHMSGAERVAILLDTLKYNATVTLDQAAVRRLNP